MHEKPRDGERQDQRTPEERLIEGDLPRGRNGEHMPDSRAVDEMHGKNAPAESCGVCGRLLQPEIENCRQFQCKRQDENRRKERPEFAGAESERPHLHVVFGPVGIGNRRLERPHHGAGEVFRLGGDLVGDRHRRVARRPELRMAVEENGDALATGDTAQAAERLPARERRELPNAGEIPHLMHDQATFGEDEPRPHGNEDRRQDEHRRRPRGVFREPHARMRHHVVEEAEIENARRESVNGEFGDGLLRRVHGLKRDAHHGYETRKAGKSEHPQAFRQPCGRHNDPPRPNGIFSERLANQHQDERYDRMNQNGCRKPCAALA